MEKRKYKLFAFVLILSLIFPFFPSEHVFASGLAFLPSFPFGQDSYYNVNNGSFSLWQVHNSNYLTYVQTFTPNNISYPNPIIIFNKTLLTSNYTYYLDYTYIIDSWDIAGLHSDGFPGTSNIRVPSPNSDFVSDDVVYATLLYTTDNIIWKNGNDVGVYAYTNFYPDGYADPTPTPSPVYTGVSMYGDYLPFQLGDIPNYGSDIYANGFEATGEVINIANALPDHLPTYASIFAGVDYDNNHYPFFGIYITDSNTFDNPLTGYQFDHIVYGPYTSVDESVSKYVHYFIRSSAYNWAVWGKPNLDNVNIPEYHWEDSSLNVVSSSYYPYLAGYGYCDFYGFNGQTNPNVSPTPTPTAIPTAIPQPTTNPNPTATPEPDYKVVVPSNHWWDGLIKPIQYIFVPSQDKMMRTYNIMSEKFGVQKPSKFEFSVDSLVRPNNVVWKFKHASLDGNDNTETQITLIDFEMIDGWLETSAGRMIIRILRAVFGLLMFGYLMYIYRKHIATINYTDAETLKEISKNNDGGDDDV